MTTKKFGNKFTNIAKFEEDVYKKPKSMKLIGEVIEDDEEDDWDDEDFDIGESYESMEERLSYNEYLATR